MELKDLLRLAAFLPGGLRQLGVRDVDRLRDLHLPGSLPEEPSGPGLSGVTTL